MILWRRLDIPGHEVAELASDRGGWRLSGVALLAHEGRPCRLEYEISCDATWQTRSATIHGTLGEVAATLDLSRSAEGAWHVDGVLVPQLQGCVDVDLGFSPSTNLLPIRRLNLAIGARASVRAAWVRFPGLTLEDLEQVYTRLGERTYLYESAGGAFRRELTVNHSGFVVDYPDFWRAEAEAAI
jgi:hypothetical protein